MNQQSSEREAVEARAREHWPKLCEKLGWEIIPPLESRIVFAADFSLAENAERDKRIQFLTGYGERRFDDAKEFLERAEAAEAEVVRLREAIEREREACAWLAENFGPSRPLSVNASHSILCRGRWEGEQAASKNIAAAIRARALNPGAAKGKE
jgi:hypothetical protein